MGLNFENATTLPLMGRLQWLIDEGQKVRVYLLNQTRLTGTIASMIHDQDNTICGFVLTDPTDPASVSDIMLKGVVSIQRL